MDKHDVFELVSNVFQDLMCKRSSQCEPGQHPNYEEEDDEQPDLEEQLIMNAEQQIIYGLMTSQPADFDDLLNRSKLDISKFSSALGMLDINEVIERHLGNRFSLKKTKPSLLISGFERTTVEAFCKYVRNFHGVSRKYLQRYLAAFWSRWGRNRWCKQTLMKTIMNYSRPNRLELLNYMSPKLVRIPYAS